MAGPDVFNAPRAGQVLVFGGIGVTPFGKFVPAKTIFARHGRSKPGMCNRFASFRHRPREPA